MSTRTWGRRVGRRFAKLDRHEWQARGLGWLEGAGMFASPLVAIATWQANGDRAIAVVAALIVALATSSIAHECYPELKSERRARIDSAYEKGYWKGVRDSEREAKEMQR